MASSKHHKNNKSFCLGHKNILFEISIQEIIFYIHLMGFPTILSCQGKEYLDGSPFCCGGKRLLIVNPFLLWKIFFHKPGFMLVKRAIYFILVFEDQLVSNWFGSQWRMNQLPGVILYQGITFFLHCFFPFIMRRDFFEGSWLKICRHSIYNHKKHPYQQVNQNCLHHLHFAWLCFLFLSFQSHQDEHIQVCLSVILEDLSEMVQC